MANLRVQQRSFSGGEISPEMFGRIDDGKYQVGLAKCRNFICKPQGPVENRPGFAFVRLSLTVGGAASLVAGKVIGVNPRYAPAEAFNQGAVVQVI